MIGYVCLGTNDLSRAATFYDELLKDLGAHRTGENERYIMWGTSPSAAMVCLITPDDGRPASVGNGVMVALTATSTAQVDALYKKAISIGAKDEGAAGPRGDGFYAGYFRDVDGNKLAVFHMG
jgi:predicted lactoylglutathione lyase